MTRSAPVGVLVMSYGTPGTPDEVEAFYTDIRRGRPPSPEQLADLRRRYDAIGGVSPLAERTTAQVAAVERALEARSPGRFCVFAGAKHSSPRIEDAVRAAADAGVSLLVGLVLAPHFSRLSVGEYIVRAREVAESCGIASRFVEQWHDDPVLIALLAARVDAAIGTLTRTAAHDPGAAGAPARRLEVVVSAHALPSRILGTGDPYPAQLAATAELVARAADLDGRGIAWRTGWQSAGRTTEPWLGPDILTVLGQLADEGVDDVVVCPAGFTSDHLEVLYDLDIEASALADRLGLGFARTASLNDDPALAASLADRLVCLASG